MIWKLPFAVGLVLLHALRAASWLLVPARWHGQAWNRDLCRYAMHDYADAGSGVWVLRYRCRRCDKAKHIPIGL